MSLLPGQILPQTVPFGTVNAQGSVLIEPNWWLLLYNICENSIGSSNTPVTPSNNVQFIEDNDIGVANTDAVALISPINALKEFMLDVPFIPAYDNPKTQIGLTVANGIAATYMRSDAAPALSQAIVPTWTGTHTFDKGIVVNGATSTAAVTVNAATGGQGVNITAVNNDYGLVIQGGGTSSESFGMLLLAGSNSSDYAMRVFNTTSAAVLMALYGDGGMVLGGATGGDKGIGTINVADGYYVGGNAITNATSANPSASVGLTVVNGSATTFLRSDGAPPLSQAIAPTWTGKHTFSPSSAGGGIFPFNSPNSGTADQDMQINRTSSVANTIGNGPNVNLSDNTYVHAIQSSGGQLEFWLNNGSWNQLLGITGVPTTGTTTAAMTATNKPGSNNQTTPAAWMPIVYRGGTVGYIPIYAA